MPCKYRGQYLGVVKVILVRNIGKLRNSELFTGKIVLQDNKYKQKKKLEGAIVMVK